MLIVLINKKFFIIFMKIYINKINESWIVDRIKKEWSEANKDISTKNIFRSNIIWIIAPWAWRNIPKSQLNSKKVICSHYHFDFANFDKEDFYELDTYVDEYHVISLKTKRQLKSLTNKKITSIPFWINQNIFFEIESKEEIRKKWNINEKEFLIGSFQRDTEGSDLISPKLIKGPDLFIEIIKNYYIHDKNLTVILTGKRREYVIAQLENLGVNYRYFEMINFNDLNELYNILNLYLVTSRIEGGPQAILECAYIKTPILSTDVGVAPEILSPESIFQIKNFSNAKVDTNTAYKNSLQYNIPNGIDKFRLMFKEFNEG